jgi:hypothetical protein
VAAIADHRAFGNEHILAKTHSSANSSPRHDVTEVPDTCTDTYLRPFIDQCSRVDEDAGILARNRVLCAGGSLSLFQSGAPMDKNFATTR